MRILSYNVNGIRASMNKGMLDWLKEDDADVLCLQEIKAQEDQIDIEAIEKVGYKAYLNPAERKGYSGVAILSKKEPDFVSTGMGNEKFDIEGRVIRADYGDITIVCVYIPSGSMGGERQDYKMEFLEEFDKYIQNLRKKCPKLVVSGDYNICHKPIDINNPERQVGVSGFLPEEREWVDEFIESGMVDTFREFDKSAEKYSWWSYRTRAKERNVGWRIDYHMVSEELRPIMKGAKIHPEIDFSDHCPISVQLKVS